MWEGKKNSNTPKKNKKEQEEVRTNISKPRYVYENHPVSDYT